MIARITALMIFSYVMRPYPCFQTDTVLGRKFRARGDFSSTNLLKGQRELIAAVQENNAEEVSLLLLSGVIPNVSDKNNSTLLHFACEVASRQIVSDLLSHNAEVNAVDRERYTPIHIAASFRRADIVSLLIASGASTSIRDKDGRTVLDIALMNKDSQIRDIIESQFHWTTLVEDKDALSYIWAGAFVFITFVYLVNINKTRNYTGGRRARSLSTDNKKLKRKRWKRD